MPQFLHKSETYQLIGICMEVYNTLGYGFSEIVYKDAIELELISRNLSHVREEKQQVKYKGTLLKHYFVSDFSLINEIIVEVKASKEGISDDMIAQTLNYLKASDRRLALIINFGKNTLEYKRLVY